MSITSRIDSIENNIRKAYDELGGIGIETDVNKNIANISAVISNYYEGLPKVSGTGTSINLLPTKVGKIKSTIIGNTTQTSTPTSDSPVEVQTVTGEQNVNIYGQQLFDYTDTRQVASEITVDEDGWITATYDNSQGTETKYLQYYVNEMNLQVNTPYKIITEIKNVSGTGSLNVVSTSTTNGQFITSISYQLDTLSAGDIKVDTSTTRDSFPAISYGTRTVVRFNAGTSGSVTFRLTVMPNVEVTPETFVYKTYQGKDYKINLGKNLFDGIIELGGLDDSTGLPYANNNALRSKNYMPVNSSKQYTLSNNKNYHMRIYEYDENYQFIQMLSALFQGSGTFTTSATTKYIKFRTISSSVENDLTSLWQLEKGSQATSYSEYFTPIELCKIGNYQDYIKKSTGKNLFDKDNVNILNANLNNNMINSASTERTIWIKCKPNTTYSFTKLVNSPYMRNIIVETTTTPAIGISVQNKSSYDSRKTFSYTTSSTAQYIVWWCYNTSSTNYTFQEILDSIQIEENSQVTDYEPYLPKETWYIEKQIGKVVLTGSETWNYNDVNQVFVTPDLVEYLRSGFVPYSNYYQGQDVTQYNQLEANHISFLQSTTNNRLLIKNLNYTGVTAFKTWLSTHNTTVYYVLETPTYTEITNEELIEQLDTWEYAKSMDGQTNISVKGDLPMILDVSALKGE